jgi:hypothetical protein
MTIPIDIIGIIAFLCAIIVSLIVALSHIYVKQITDEIKRVHHRIDPIEKTTTRAHQRLDDHVEDYHTVKS